MLISLMPCTGLIGAGMSGLTASVSAAIAYASGLENSRIIVSHENGNLVLSGVAANRTAMEAAISIASHIGGCPVHNRIEAAI